MLVCGSCGHASSYLMSGTCSECLTGRLRSTLVAPAGEDWKSPIRELLKEAPPFFGHLYIGGWIFTARLRELVFDTALIALLVTSGALVVDVVGLKWGHEILRKLPGAAVWLVGVGGLILVWHRYKDYKDRRKRPVYLNLMRTLLREFGKLSFAVGEPGNKDKLDHFITRVLRAFQEVIETPPSLRLNVMLQGADGRLKVFYLWPPNSEHDPEFSLAIGEGGAGKAFADGLSIYIPVVEFLHGVKITMPATIETSGGLKPIAPRITRYFASRVFLPGISRPFRCVLSVPIITEGPAPLGVLNLDAPQWNAFGKLAFHAGETAAVLLGMAIDKHRASL